MHNVVNNKMDARMGQTIRTGGVCRETQRVQLASGQSDGIEHISIGRQEPCPCQARLWRHQDAIKAYKRTVQISRWLGVQFLVVDKYLETLVVKLLLL